MPRDYDPRQVVRMLWCLACRICTITVWNADQVCAKCGKEIPEEHGGRPKAAESGHDRS
jgi:hypothetical protein